MDENLNKNETNRILREILKWERFKGIEILKKKIKVEKLLQEKEEIIVYYRSNGDKSSRDLGNIANLSYKKIQALWKKWVQAGIAIQTEKYRGGRCKRLFDLNELGLELPKSKKKKK